MRSCPTVTKVGKPNQTVRKTTEETTLQSYNQLEIEYGGVRKKSLVREAILKFSEKNLKTESVPKLEAPKSEIEIKGVAPEETLKTSEKTSKIEPEALKSEIETKGVAPEIESTRIVNQQETNPTLTQPKPNPCTPPTPKPPVVPAKMAQSQKMMRPPHHQPNHPSHINQLNPGRIEVNQVNSEQETNPNGNQPKEEINQERGKKVVKEGGKPQKPPKPYQKTTNQTRAGKPNQKGENILKEGGQPTIAEILARKEGNQTIENQKQTSTNITGTKPKTKKPQEPNQTNPKPPKSQQTIRKQNNEGGKQ